MEKIESLNMTLGDRIKAYEHQFTDITIDPSLPYIARVDGRGFSKFTSKMEKPFDARFTSTMCSTAIELVKEFRPILAYVQSDEISLLFRPETEPMFSGKLSKLNSIIASTATYWFNKELPKDIPQKGIPIFDCRIFNVPTEWEAVNALRFRYRDAVRNSISSAARYMFGHKATNGKNSDEKLEMIGEKWNTFPDAARYGVFYHRVDVEKPCAPFVITKDLRRIPTSDTCIRTEIHEFLVQAEEGGVCNLNSPTHGIDRITNMPEILFGNDPFVKAVYSSEVV